MRSILIAVLIVLISPLSILAQSGVGGGGQTNVSGGGSGSGGVNGAITSVPPPGAINPAAAPYSAKFDAGTVNLATTTNASNIVTCPSCKFQTGTIVSGNPPAVVGQIFFANDATAGQGGVDTCLDNPDILFGGLRQTTISSVDSDTQIHVVGNSGTTSTAHACIAWGTDDTTAINSAWTAGGCTSSQWLPVGKALISAPIWQIIAGCPNVANSGTGYQGQRIWGGGVVNSYIIPVPLFNFTSIAGSGSPTCTGAGCKAAIGNPNIADYEGFNVYGIGERCSATQANTILWLVGSATRAINTNGIGWCGEGGGTTLSGYSITGITDIYTWGGSNFFGSVVMNLNSTLIYFGNSFVSCTTSGITGTAGVILQAGASVNSVSNGFSCAVQVGVASGTGAVYNSINSLYNGNDLNTASCIYVGQNSTINLLSNDFVCNGAFTNETAINYFSTTGTGGRVNASSSQFVSNGTSAQIAFGTSGGVFNDISNNSFSGGTGKSSGTGTILKPLSEGNCSGVGTAASPSVASCGASGAGSFSCSTAASTATCQVNTTAVTANSTIQVFEDITQGTKLGVTCNTGSAVLPATPLLASKSAGVSFTINLGTVATNPACFTYTITN